MSRNRMTAEAAKQEMVKQRRPRSRRRSVPPWKRRLMLGVLLLAALVAAAPTIATRTLLRAHILSWVGQKLQLQIGASGAAAGWLAPLRLENAALCDAHGEPLLEVAAIHINKSLLDLLRDRRQLGTIRLERPTVYLSLRDDGSNWEDALAPLLVGDSDLPPPNLELELVEGQLQLQDARHMRSWRIGPLDAELSLDSRSETPLSGKLTASIQSDQSDAESGQLTIDLFGSDQQLSDGKGKISAEDFPLEVLQAIAGRWTPSLRLKGLLNLDSSLSWSSGADPRRQLTIRSLEIRQLQCRAPGMAGKDMLRLSHVNGSGGVRIEEGRLLVDNLKLESEAASVHALAQLRMNRPGGWSWLHLDDEDQLSLAAQLDLARLAQMLPSTLRIRPDTRFESGRLTATLSSQGQAEQRRWQGRVDATDVFATAAGRQVRWEQPVQLIFNAAQAADGWSIQQLSCTTSFLQLTARGTMAGGMLQARGDLNRLQSELSQLVELGSPQMAGKFIANVKWKQDAQSLVADGRLDLEQFTLSLPGRTPLQEQQLTILAVAQGKTDGVRLRRLDEAKLTIQAASDELVAELLKPVGALGSEASIPLRIGVRGGLDRWLQRGVTLSGNAALRGNGHLSLSADVTVSPQQIVIAHSKLEAAPCQLEGFGLPIDEPRLEAHVRGTYHIAARRWQGGETTVTSSAIAVRCDNLLLQLGAAGPGLAGDIAYRGDLSRVSQLVAVSADRRLTGQFQGQARLAQQDGATQFELRQRLNNFVMLRLVPTRGVHTALAKTAWKEAWREPYLDVSGAGVYRPADNKLELEQLQLVADSVNFSGQGSFTDLQDRLHTSLKGELQYDLQRLFHKLQPLLGQTALMLEGVSQSPVSVRGPLRAASTASGPLVPPELRAETSVGWKSAVIQGVAIGPGELQSTLQQSQVRFDDIDLAVSQGRVQLSPIIDLSASAPILRVASGQVDQLRISPEMCRNWLKYVAPLLADVAQIEGTFSASLQQLAVPLTAPRTAGMQGTLTIHEGRAGPGPLAQQLLQLVQQTKKLIGTARQGGNPLQGGGLDRALDLLGDGQLLGGSGGLDPQGALRGLLGTAPGQQSGTPNWVLLPEHMIEFQMADGRVYHQGMRMVIDGVEVRTSGFVGLDQSLSLTTEIQIPQKWIGQAPLLAGLSGQAVRVPVQGTLRRPRVDPGALQQMGRQLLQDAVIGGAGHAAGGDLERALRGMFNR